MPKHNTFFGVIIILAGFLFLLVNFDVLEIQYENLWPFFLFIPGIFFETAYFSNPKKGKAGLLVPGTILIIYAFLFWFHIYWGWQWMAKLWPIFMLGVAVGLFKFYLFGGRDKQLFIPIGILTFLSLFFLTLNWNIWILKYLLPLLLIIFGLYVIIRGNPLK